MCDNRNFFFNLIIMMNSETETGNAGYNVSFEYDGYVGTIQFFSGCGSEK